MVPKNRSLVPAPEAGGSTYLVTLQAVFNDPHLYGLRIALDGDAAKIFKGLDFQIMYRQISKTVGVYQAEITLPDLMRHLTVGAYTITLPVFGIAIYTNGNFQVDIGFPWHHDFARSFSVEAIIYPGIPVLGSAGFYFGELSSATTKRVPQATNGRFNPVHVFGFGAQVGFGKSIEAGILKAGFSLTVCGIIEGILAKWNPYPGSGIVESGGSQLEGEYYFWLQGTFGILGKLYGSIDFAIVKADVDIEIALLAQITFESYEPIPISVIASVSVSITVRINCGLFKIKIHCHFSAHIKETFTLEVHGDPPWKVSSGIPEGVLSGPASRRLRAIRLLEKAGFREIPTPNWKNLKTTENPLSLHAYLSPGLTAAGDAAADLAEQEVCYVAMFLLDSTAPETDPFFVSATPLPEKQLRLRFNAMLDKASAQETKHYTVSGLDVQGAEIDPDDGRAVILTLSGDAAPGKTTVSIAKKTVKTSTGAYIGEPLERTVSRDGDTSFERLSKMVFRWAIAAIQDHEMSAGDVDKLPVGDDELQGLADYLADPKNATALDPDSIGPFLDGQFRLGVELQVGEGEARATYFPMPRAVQLDVPEYAPDPKRWPKLSYTFGDYNTIGPDYVKNLRDFFDKLAVKVQDENGEGPGILDYADGEGPSLGSFIFGDYFLLLVRQMVRGAQDSLRNMKLRIPAGRTVEQIVEEINGKRGSGVACAYTPYDLLVANARRPLKPGSRVTIRATHTVAAGETFDSIARHPLYGGAFTARELVAANAGKPWILEPGVSIAEPDGKTRYVCAANDTFAGISEFHGVSLDGLADAAGIDTESGLLRTFATLDLPAFVHEVTSGETLESIADRFGVPLDRLAAEPANAMIEDLFDDEVDPCLDVPHLGQLTVADILADMQKAGKLDALSGMAARYYLHGLRLPTDGVTPQHRGMWVDEDKTGKLTLPKLAGLYALTGQQFPLPPLGEKDDPLEITFSSPDCPSWLHFEGGEKGRLILKIDPNPDVKDPKFEQIDAVRTFATAHRLQTGLDLLGPSQMVKRQMQRYPLSSSVLWQSARDVALPYGTKPAKETLRIWRLPDAILALPNLAVRAIDPRFDVRIGSYDEATGGARAEKLSYYGWGATIDFQIKRVPPSDDSPTTKTTYEIAGASDESIVLLERLLAEIGQGTSPIFSLTLAYGSDPTADESVGVQSDDTIQVGASGSTVTLGIAQVNLSTETRPPTAYALEPSGDTSSGLGLLNRPEEFLRLLWEASITRSGGFYLFYRDGTKERGLPDRIFNDKGEASVSLIVLLSKPGTEFDQNRLTEYTNTLVSGESVDPSRDSLYAEAAPLSQKIAADPNEALASIAYRYFSDVGELAELNAELSLVDGIDLVVADGLYRVGPEGSEPGGDLSKISEHFGLGAQGPELIKKANPRRTDWPTPLPPCTALRLPKMTVQVGKSLGGATLESISDFYGQDIASLAAQNGKVIAFAVGSEIEISGGPKVSAAMVPTGVVAFEASRPTPPDVPDDSANPNFAEDLLLNAFSLLNYRIVGNGDFTASDIGLPAGPTDPSGESKGLVPEENRGEPQSGWSYRFSIPYESFVAPDGSEGSSENPYRGIDRLLAVELAWQDHYGNLLHTALSDPQKGDPTQWLNRPPALTGYVDPLVGLGQWPAISSGWRVPAPADGSGPHVEVALGFDPSPYRGLLRATPTEAADVRVLFTDPVDKASAEDAGSYKLTGSKGTAADIKSAVLAADGVTVTLTVSKLTDAETWTLTAAGVKPKDPDAASFIQASATFLFDVEDSQPRSSIQSNIDRALRIYGRLYAQMKDPNGIAAWVETTLVTDGKGNPHRFDLDLAGDDSLLDWLFEADASVYKYISAQGDTKTTSPEPAVEFSIDLPFDLEDVNPEQLFKLSLSLGIERTGGLVLGDLETTPGPRRSVTAVSPALKRLKEKTSGEGTTETTVGLQALAEGLEQTVRVEGAWMLKVATGADRTEISTTRSGGALWAVRVGLGTGEAISYAIADEGEPEIFAPRPISNRLESGKADIYGYDPDATDYDPNTGLSKTPTENGFHGIDMDVWGRQLFDGIDGVLSPEFTAAIQVVDASIGSTYLDDLLGLGNEKKGKKQLADIVKLWMVSVYAGKAWDAGNAQEAFKQRLLERLANAYTTRAAVQFEANVSADIHEGPEASQPPRLFGGLQEALDPSPSVGDGDETVGAVTLSSAKLELKEQKELPITFLLSASDTVKGAGGEVVPYVDLDLDYVGDRIEHQIGKLSGIQDYQPSSWLRFVVPLAENGEPASGGGYPPLRKKLGSFKVPMILRAFPSVPSMASQSGTTILPFVKDVEAASSSNEICVQFSNPMDPASAAEAENYVVSGCAVSEVGLSSDGLTATLSVAGEVKAGETSVTVRSSIRDAQGWQIKPPYTRVVTKASGVGASVPLSSATEWGYAFTYSLPFHYPQDRIHGRVEFNIKQDQAVRDVSVDLFAKLAQFVTVFPAVEQDLRNRLAPIEIGADDDALKKASRPLLALKTMVGWVVDAAGADGLVVESPRRGHTCDEVLTYEFTIEEGSVTIGDVEALAVTLEGALPAGIGDALVLVDPETYACVPRSEGSSDADGRTFVYLSLEDGKTYLSAEEGQTIPDRQVVLCAMSVLRRQDAWATVLIKRNENLTGTPTADPFVYQTPEVRFSSPALPTIDQSLDVEIQDIPSGKPAKRTLTAHLKALFDALLEGNEQPEITLQVECRYDFPINPHLSPISRPVLMQPPLKVDVGGASNGATSLDDAIERWVSGVKSWLDARKPEDRADATLRFDLTIMSNMTDDRPMPLLRLRNLSLPLEYVTSID